MDRLPLEILINIIKRLHKYDRDNFSLSCKQFNNIIKYTRNQFICYQKIKHRFTFVEEVFKNKQIVCNQFYCILGYIPREITMTIDNNNYKVVIKRKENNQYEISSYRVSDIIFIVYYDQNAKEYKTLQYTVNNNFIQQICGTNMFDEHYYRPLSLLRFGYNQLLDILPQIYEKIQQIIYKYYKRDCRDPTYIMDLLTIYHYSISRNELYNLGKIQSDCYAIFHNFYFGKRIQSYVFYNDVTKYEIIEAKNFLSKFNYYTDISSCVNFILFNRFNIIISDAGLNWYDLFYRNPRFRLHSYFGDLINDFKQEGIIIHMPNYLVLDGKTNELYEIWRLSLIYLNLIEPDKCFF